LICVSAGSHSNSAGQGLADQLEYRAQRITAH
jgi:hypothetical protein